MRVPICFTLRRTIAMNASALRVERGGVLVERIWLNGGDRTQGCPQVVAHRVAERFYEIRVCRDERDGNDEDPLLELLLSRGSPPPPPCGGDVADGRVPRIPRRSRAG